jgi:hypothetical protein
MIKKITNNALWGRITVLFNLLILVAFILSVVALMGFDKENRVLVEKRPEYEQATMKMQEARQPSKGDSTRVAYYSQRLDSLSAMPTPKVAAEAKNLKSEIKRVSDILAKEIKNKAKTDSIIKVTEANYIPIKTDFTEIEKATNDKKATFSLLLYITLTLVVLKILFFAIWNYRNSKNLHQLADWMKNGNAPYWAFVSWLIPAYNLIKPYTFFNELMNESIYLLNDKSILPKKEVDNHEFYIGIWWTFFLLTFIISPLILYSTFFAEGPMFYKFNHLSIAIVSASIGGIYLLIESVLIFLYNKYNKLMMSM